MGEPSLVTDPVRPMLCDWSTNNVEERKNESEVVTLLHRYLTDTLKWPPDLAQLYLTRRTSPHHEPSPQL